MQVLKGRGRPDSRKIQAEEAAIFGNSWNDNGFGSISTEGSIQVGDDDGDVCDQDHSRYNTDGHGINEI